MTRPSRLALATTVLALAAAPATLAKQGGRADHGGGPHATKPAKAHDHAKLRRVVAKGTIVSIEAAGIVVVHVTKANHRGGALVGQDVRFDVSQAKLSAADTDGDGAVTVADLAPGDHVVIKTAKLAPDAAQLLVARQLVDQTHPESDESDAQDVSDEHDVPVAHDAPETPVA